MTIQQVVRWRRNKFGEFNHLSFEGDEEAHELKKADGLSVVIKEINGRGLSIDCLDTIARSTYTETIIIVSNHEEENIH